MQLASQGNDFMEFKDEVMKKIRLVENKFLSEFNSKFSQVNSNFEKMDIKINTISQNNNSLLDLVTKQNFNFDKVNEFDIYKTKTDQSLITQKIQIKNILQEIRQIKDNFEKIVTENLIIPGSIGPGSIYKNLADYLVYQMNEFNKLRNDIEQNKKKVGDWEKTAINIISNSLLRFQSYIDNKIKQMHVVFDKKYEVFNTKILDIETKIENFEFKIDKSVKSIQDDMQKITKAHKTNKENTNKKFEEINQRIDSLIKDFEYFKKLKFQSLLKNKENNFDTINSISGKNNKFFHSNKNIFTLNRNLSLTGFMGQIQEKKMSNNTSNKDDDQKNSSSINNNNNNNNNYSQILSDVGSPMRKNSSSQFNNNESKNNNEENNLLLLPGPGQPNKDQISKDVNNLNDKPYIKVKNLENLKLMNKRKNIHNKTDNFKKFNSINIFSKDKEIIEESNKNKKYMDKAINVGSSSLIKTKQISNIKNISTDNMSNNMATNNKAINKEQTNIPDLSTNKNNISSNNKNTLTTNKNTNSSNRIQINSINKPKGEKNFNTLAIKENDINLSKNEINSTIRPTKSKDTSSFENLEKADKNKEINFIQSKDSSSNTKIKQMKTKEDINLELNNKENTNINLKAFIPTKSYLTTTKENVLSASKKTQINLPLNSLNINVEQEKIMSKIREYYNNRKKLTEKKSTEKIVDCNIINLNLRNSSKNNRRSSHSTPRNTFYSSRYSKMNKIANFGNTNYKFFSKRERYSRARSLNSSDNNNNY